MNNIPWDERLTTMYEVVVPFTGGDETEMPEPHLLAHYGAEQVAWEFYAWDFKGQRTLYTVMTDDSTFLEPRLANDPYVASWRKIDA